MTTIQTRNSALAIKVETTEGTPVVPAAASDYVALQDDFAMEPAVSKLENAELKASLAPSKPISGIEEPTASFSHYLRHSGTEGTAPNYSEILEAAFGNEEVEGTEYNTVAASTTAITKVDTGEGAEFRKGQGLLIKDETNGYSIRAVDAIATDDLTNSFLVDTAPAVGVDLGKAVLYYPDNSSHQTLSLWHYLGNGGATQLMSGSRVTSSTFSIAAGELINASYDFEGISYHFNPITIDATNDDLDFDDAGGEENVSITQKTYKEPHDLASALQIAMNTATTDAITVTYSNSTGKFTIASDGVSLSLLWSTGTNTATTIGGALGFTVTADDTGATTYTSDAAITFASPQTASFDATDPLVAKENELFIGDQDDNSCFAASTVEVSMSTPKSNIDSICADTGRSGSLINSREVTISISALLNQYDADWFRRLSENTETKFQYNGGTKDAAGNWQAGKCFCLYAPTCVVSSISLDDAEGLVQLNLELSAYVNSDGEDEIVLSFL